MGYPKFLIHKTVWDDCGYLKLPHPAKKRVQGWLYNNSSMLTIIVPYLSGCITYGDTIEEAKEMAKEAIGLYFESQKAYEKEEKGGFRFDWEGGLSELKEKYASVKLQHKALNWRKNE